MEPATIAALGMAGGSILGGISGFAGAKSGSSGMKRMAAVMQAQLAEQKRIAAEQESIAKPFRDILYPQIQNYLRDPSSITSGPLYGAYISPLAQQFNTARSGLEESLPRGGALTSALTNLYSTGARARSGVMADLYNKYEGMGMDIGRYNTQPGMMAAQSGMNMASSMMPSYSNVYGAGMQQVGQAGYGLGSTLYDYYMGKGGGGNTNLNYGLNIPQPSPFSLNMNYGG